jgi:hypothetical protein
MSTECASIQARRRSQSQRGIQPSMEMNDGAFEATEDETLVRIACNAALNRADDGAILAGTDLGEMRIARRVSRDCISSPLRLEQFQRAQGSAASR